jgi:alpha-tubulin suppressor-like RCC1 family protein
MGYNGEGQLGDGTFNSTNRPEEIMASNVVAISAGDMHSLFIMTNGSLWAMGYNADGALGDGTTNELVNVPEKIVGSNVVAIAAGNDFSLFVKSDGSLWGMGYDGYGQLGDGFTNATSSVPEQIYPTPQPVLTANALLQTNLQLEATCKFGGTFALLTATNPGESLKQWTPVWTNVISGRSENNFDTTLTNGVRSDFKSQFYILRSQ